MNSNEPIRVLLADDTLIAREGWKRILETSDNIKAVGEAVVIEAVLPQAINLQPDVALLDLKWDYDQQAGLNIIPLLRREVPATRIIAISSYDELLARARKVGANGALPKAFTRESLLATIHAVCHEELSADTWMVDRERASQAYMARLASLRTGQRDAKKYEELIKEILEFLFVQHLSEFASQCRHHDGDEIWDIVAFNKSNDPFWSTLRQEHHASQILFELKNVRLLRADHVLQLADYLDAPLMHFGALITRNPPHQSAVKKARNKLANRQKVILILTDDDIAEMLRTAGNGEDPTAGFSRIYVALVRTS